MKRMTLCILLLALLVGCNKKNAEETKDGGELVFNLMVDGMLPVESRAVSDMPDFNTRGFDIAGYGTTNRFEDNVIDSPTATLPTPNLFGLNIDMVPVPHIDKQLDGTFRSPLSKIPLLEGTYLSFFAWSQNKLRDKVSGIIESTDDETDKGFPYLKILVPDAPQSQFDIVAARSTNHENDYVISAVDLDFNHILSKLTFRATSSTGNQVTIDAVKISYGTNKVYRGGTFTFASSGALLGSYGTYTGYQSGQHALGTSFATIFNGSTSALGDMLLMPQSLTDDFASIDITYRITLFGSAEQQITKSVPLKAITLEYGKNYVFTLNITATEILMSAGSIENWLDGGTSLPMLSGPRGDVLLLLDGKDAPYTHFDGTNYKKYWLDRSGYNHHCEIIGDVPYNSADKAYVFDNTETNYVSVPPLGDLTAVTIQVATVVSGAGDHSVFLFSDKDPSQNSRVLFTHLPWTDNKIYFDAGPGDRIYIDAGAVSAAQLQTYSLYTYRKGVPFMGISRNDSYHITANGKTFTVGTATYNYIGRKYSGNVKYFKLTKRSITAAEMSSDYSYLKKWCNLPDDEPPANFLPPVTTGLILCLDGRSGIENIGGKNVWKDQTPIAGNLGGNHAEILGSVPHDVNRFTFPGINGNYMKLLKTLGPNQAYTIEFVVKSNIKDGNTTLFLFSSDAICTNREFHVHYPYSGKVYFDSPFANKSSDNRIDIAVADLPYAITQVNQWQITRATGVADSYIIRMNGKVVSTGTGSSSLGEMLYNYIGSYGTIGSPFAGDLYSMRMYNRVLTSDDLERNMNFDRRVYNIPY